MTCERAFIAVGFTETCERRDVVQGQFNMVILAYLKNAPANQKGVQLALKQRYKRESEEAVKEQHACTRSFVLWQTSHTPTCASVR